MHVCHNITKEYGIPTSNPFDLLTDDVTNEGDDTNKHLELMCKENNYKKSRRRSPTEGQYSARPPSHCPTKDKFTT
jgi:hypothetical protein